jgi:hypothetical protein
VNQQESDRTDNALKLPGKRLVIAFFEKRPSADHALRTLEEHAVKTGRLGTVGALALDGEGRVDESRLGDRITGGEPGVGTVLNAIAQILAGATSAPRSRPFENGPNLTTDDIARYGAQLDAGDTAVAVLDTHREAELAVVQLTELGGMTEMRHLMGWLRQPSID